MAITGARSDQYVPKYLETSAASASYANAAMGMRHTITIMANAKSRLIFLIDCFFMIFLHKVKII